MFFLSNDGFCLFQIHAFNASLDFFRTPYKGLGSSILEIHQNHGYKKNITPGEKEQHLLKCLL